jgi:hypothetical protein
MLAAYDVLHLKLEPAVSFSCRCRTSTLKLAPVIPNFSCTLETCCGRDRVLGRGMNGNSRRVPGVCRRRLYDGSESQAPDDRVGLNGSNHSLVLSSTLPP